MASTLIKDFSTAFQAVLKTKAKAECGESVVEYFDFTAAGQDDASSAFLGVIANGIFANDTNNNIDFGFAKFMGEDFIKYPFILVSKERKVAEKAQKQMVSPFESANNRFVSPNKKVTRSEEEKSDSSEVWGSPLKSCIPSDDSSIDCDLFELSQMPATKKKLYSKRVGVPVNTARRFVSTFNLQFGDTPDLPSFVVLCDGTDLRTTSVYGSHINHFMDQGKMSKIFKTTTVNVHQKTSADWNAKVKVAGSKSPSCRAMYQVSMPAEEEEEHWGAVVVEMTWNGASQLLESPPSNARSTVKASVRSGSMRSSMHKFFLELDLLKRIITSLNTGEMVWMSDTSVKSTMPIVMAVRNLIICLKDEESMMGSQVTDDAEEVVPFTSALKGISVVERSDYDFTDHLWKVLSECMSTADLIDALRLLFSTLSRREMKPFVDQQNHTTVAQIVRESFSGRYSAPSLTGLQPLLFLAEIGAEKLRRDYINIFVSQRLASLSFLSPFITSDRELPAKLASLEKLHTSLEMVALLSATLHLSVDILGSVVRQMLTHFSQNAVNPQHMHNFALKTAEVHAVMASLQPVMWSIETFTSVGVADVCESNLYCLCATQPFLHISSSAGESVSQVEESKAEKGSGVTPNPENEYCLVHRQEMVIIL